MRLQNVILSALALSLSAAPAIADAKSESFVAENAANVLQSLNQSDLNDRDRQERFAEYIDEFTNLEVIARQNLGKYAKQFTPEEMERYQVAFRDFALAAYEYYFYQYRGQDVQVVGSIDRNARDSIVNTKILTQDGTSSDVRWRVLNRNGEYVVVDVALNVEGNVLWLAIEQQAQFISILNRNGGDVDKLIEQIKSQTAETRRDTQALKQG